MAATTRRSEVSLSRTYGGLHSAMLVMSTINRTIGTDLVPTLSFLFKISLFVNHPRPADEWTPDSRGPDGCVEIAVCA
jgi:hypothetical protein